MVAWTCGSCGSIVVALGALHPVDSQYRRKLVRFAAAVANQPIAIAVLRHVLARTVPTACRNAIAGDLDQLMGDLVARFFKARNTSKRAIAHKLSLLDPWRRMYLGQPATD